MVPEERIAERLGQLLEADTLSHGRLDRPVVHVGEIPHLDDLVPFPFQVAAQDVLEEEGPEVPDVGGVVDRGSAGVDADAPPLQRLELLHPASKGVVQS